MPDELAGLLPTASLTGAMFGLWLTSTRDSVRKAIEAKYERNSDPKSAITLGCWLVWVSVWVPVSVVVILIPVVLDVLSALSLKAPYSPTRAFFLVVVALWVFLLIWSIRDVWKVQSNACAVRTDRMRLQTPKGE